jgi:tetratricopeptide (TPR) repeat protein
VNAVCIGVTAVDEGHLEGVFFDNVELQRSVMCNRDGATQQRRLASWTTSAFLNAGLFLIVLACSVASLGQQQSPVVADIVAQLLAGNNQEASLLAKRALAAHPADCKLLSLNAVALTGLGRTEEALHSFEKALTKCPAYLPALEGAAQIEYAQQNPEVMRLLNRILAVQPDNVTAHAMLATTLRPEGRCEEALSHFAASRALFSTRPELLQGYGYCLAQTGDLKSALTQYLDLLASHPNDRVRYNVALLQWKTDAADDALATLAPLFGGNQKEAVFALASKICEEKGNTPRAVALLRAAILEAPDNVDNYLDFADLAFNHKSFQVGIDMLNAGLKRMSDSAPLYVARGVLEVQLSHSDAAIADFDHAHRLDPLLSFAVDAIGIMQSQQHQNSQSLALFESQAKLHPDDALVQYLLAEQLSQNTENAGDTDLAAAIAAAKRATDLDPNYQAAHDLLAVLYIRAKQPKLAIQQAELALAEDPNDQVALYQEIMARRRSGDTSQIQALTARLNEIRKKNGSRQQATDRYRLQDEISH